MTYLELNQFADENKYKVYTRLNYATVEVVNYSNFFHYHTVIA